MLPCRKNDEKLRGAILEEILLTEALNDGEAERECFSHTRSLSSNQVILVVDDVVCLVLDREQLLHTLLMQYLYCSSTVDVLLQSVDREFLAVDFRSLAGTTLYLLLLVFTCTGFTNLHLRLVENSNDYNPLKLAKINSVRVVKISASRGLQF